MNGFHLKLESMSSSSACKLLSICICFITELRALQIFVMDEAKGRKFCVEPSPDANVGDLRAEIASITGAHPGEFAVLFQGQPLTDWRESLADSGLSNECLVVMQPIDPVIELLFDNKERFSDRMKVNGSDVLQWDTGKDIAQFAWLREMDLVAIELNEIRSDALARKMVVYKDDDYTMGTSIVSTSHLFCVVPIEEEFERHGVDQSPPGRVVKANELQKAEYEHNMLVAPTRDQTMDLAFYDSSGEVGYYVFPRGYGLLLRYPNGQNVTQMQD